MRTHKLIGFLFQFATIGLAAAFIVVYFYPELINRTERVVEVREQPSTAPVPEARSRGIAPLPVETLSYAPAVEQAAPAVVNIFSKKTVTQRQHPFLDDPIFRRFFGDTPEGPSPRQETSLGSGVIVSPQGYLLTNNHVIEGAEEIQVALRDGRRTEAKLVGTDPDTDLSVLHIDLPRLPVITLAQSDAVRVGDIVLAIGNPFGVGQTVTSGIVSATGRSHLGINTFENFIQTDAAINPGNSGGALINSHGQLIGINTAIFTRSGGSQGIGFAIPVSLAKGVLTEIIEHGEVVRGWLGVEIQDLSPELAESFGLKRNRGVVIAGVFPDSPAARAGLKRGDVITRIQGQAVDNVNGALKVITNARPETVLTIGGLRNGEGFTIEARIARRKVETLRD